MARSVPWRRVISDAASWHQDQALNSTIYILRQTGPTGFLLKEEGETKKFKVFLGDPHKCTCPVFAKEKDLCKHIQWILLKKFRLPRQNPLTWQLGLVEREINEILHGILAHQEAQPSHAVRKYASVAAHMGRDPNSGQAVIPQREISKDDVCPICQDELLAKHLPVTYCKFGCGNNVHIKCMKVWADHQKSSGKTTIECPFCREDFGPISLLQQEMKNSTQREMKADRMNEHLGTTCRKCHVCPIKGKCYKCSVCVDYHLCQACFNTPVHMEHNFLFRQKATQRWRPTANRSQGGLLPDAIVTNLMARDISEEDYDLLLQLDNQSTQQLSDLTEETIQSFPMERVRQNGPLLAPGQQCRICLRSYEVGQFVRRLPCHHKYHRDCIDNWLLHRHPTCPIDGTTYSNESVRLMKEANRERLRQLQINSSAHADQTSNRTVRGFRSHRNVVATNGDLDLQIPGIGIARIATVSNNSVPQSQTNQSNPNNESHNESLVTCSVQPEDHVQGARNGGSASSSANNSGHYSDLNGLTVGEVVGINIRQPSVNTLEDNIIDVIASTNRPYHVGGADGNNDDDEDDDDSGAILPQIPSDSRSGSSHSSVLSSAVPGHTQLHFRPEVGQSENVSSALGLSEQSGPASLAKEDQAVINGNIMFDPSHKSSVKDFLFHEILGHDHANNRQNRLTQRQTGLNRKQIMKQIQTTGREMNQSDINVSGQQLPDLQNRVKNGSHQEDQSAHVPSIPLPRNDIMLGIGNANPERENTIRKPPSGESIHRQGRLRSRISQRDINRTNSRGRERSSSRERKDQACNFDSLYIGHSPSTRVGFNSEFLLSTTESKSSKSLQRAKARHEVTAHQSTTRRNTTEPDPELVNDLALAGNGLT